MDRGDGMEPPVAGDECLDLLTPKGLEIPLVKVIVVKASTFTATMNSP